MGYPLSEEIDLRPTWAQFRLKSELHHPRIEPGYGLRRTTLGLGAAILLLALWAVWPNASPSRAANRPMLRSAPAVAAPVAVPAPMAVSREGLVPPRHEPGGLTETVAAFNKKLIGTKRDTPLAKSAKRNRARSRAR